MSADRLRNVDSSIRKDEVLANLRDISYRNVKDWAIETVSTPQSILFVIGRPGAGKTTVISQVFRDLRDSMRDNLGIISFDLVRAALIEETHKDPSFWTSVHWKELNRRLIVGVQMQVNDGKGVILEYVGVGIKDRGTTALQFPYHGVLKKSVLGLVPEDLKDVIAFRRYVGSTSNYVGLKGKILNIFNIDFGVKFDDSEASGKEIVGLIKNMAKGN